MHYFSTRGDGPVGFREVVMGGLARDGGLFLPESIPDVSAQLPALRSMSYGDLATALMTPFMDLPAPVVAKLVAGAYSGFSAAEVTPVRRVGDQFILELFHGPTLAFKDLALQFLGRLFSHYLAASDERLNLVVATSGDTGSAAIHGVRGRERLRIFVMHPHGRISRSQEKQMTSVLDDNVHNLAIEGTFDDCQSIAKALFNDLPFKDRYALGSVNSINWARVLPQVVYYFYGAFRVMDATGATGVSFAVPTGNFGDIFAGYLASRMGLPVRRLVLATNENDILSRFFNQGEYRVGAVRGTISPSMDIQVASNFERYLYYRCGGDAGQVRSWMRSFSADGGIEIPMGQDGVMDPLFRAGAGDTAETLATIQRYHRDHGYLLDPHTAVGVAVSGRFREDGYPMICLATAHPAKFGETMARAVGAGVVRHPLLEALEDSPTRMEVRPATVEAVAQYVSETLDAVS